MSNLARSIKLKHLIFEEIAKNGSHELSHLLEEKTIYPENQLNPDVKLIVVTASYSRDVQRRELYERTVQSFSDVNNVEFLLACSGEGYLGYPSQLHIQNRTSQFRTLKTLFDITPRDRFHDDDIVMMMDDDDTLHHIPDELVKMSYNSDIRGLSSLQAIPVRDGNFLELPLNLPLSEIDDIFSFLSWTNDFSGYALRWKECVEWFSNLELTPLKELTRITEMIEKMIDTKFMNYVDSLQHLTPVYPFVYRSPASMTWLE